MLLYSCAVPEPGGAAGWPRLAQPLARAQRPTTNYEPVDPRRPSPLLARHARSVMNSPASFSRNIARRKSAISRNTRAAATPKPIQVATNTALYTDTAIHCAIRIVTTPSVSDQHQFHCPPGGIHGTRTNSPGLLHCSIAVDARAG